MSKVGWMLFVMHKKTALLLFLGKFTIGNPLEERWQSTLCLFWIPNYSKSGNLEFKCFESNCKARLVYVIDEGSFEFQGHHKCFVQIGKHHFYLLDHGLYHSALNAFGYFWAKKDSEKIVDLLIEDDLNLTNWCISIVPKVKLYNGWRVEYIL